jgi:exopolyphosphatase / guanosine-5'-triphosphate,3'-diphosphate pyrophosphatase
LKPDRRPVIAGGLALLYTLAAQFGIARLAPAKGALRQGVIVELAERLAPPREARQDRRQASVRELQRRFGVDTAQADRVRSVALALYAGARPDAASADVRQLGWAAALHEVGLMVSHHDHHRHSHYLLANVDAAAFSQTEQRALAAIVLGQRGGLRKIESHLNDLDFALKVLALRLACIKCHARGAVDPQALRLRADGANATLAFSAAWAESHPRTLYLLQREAEAWARSGAVVLALAGGSAPRAA